MFNTAISHHDLESLDLWTNAHWGLWCFPDASCAGSSVLFRRTSAHVDVIFKSYSPESHGQPLFTQVTCQVKILKMLFPPVHIEDQPPTGGFRVPNLKSISCATWATENRPPCASRFHKSWLPPRVARHLDVWTGCHSETKEHLWGIAVQRAWAVSFCSRALRTLQILWRGSQLCCSKKRVQQMFLKTYKNH